MKNDFYLYHGVIPKNLNHVMPAIKHKIFPIVLIIKPYFKLSKTDY
jgi:hypothetical protein